MRWLVCCLLFPLTANAASVLLVPADDKARVLADELVEPFAAAKLTVKTAGPGSPAVNCLKEPDMRVGCLQGIEEKAKVVAVFVVSGALKGAKGTLTLEMMAKGDVLKKESFKVTKGKVKKQLRGPIANLLKLLPVSETSTPTEQPKMTVTQKEPEPEPVPDVPKEPEPVTDVPKKTEPVAIAPTTTADPLSIKQAPPRPVKSKAAAWVVTGLAVVAAGTAATFAGLGFADKAALEQQSGVATISYNDAVALRDASNAKLSVALGTGIGAGVAGVVAGILWGVE